MARGSCEKEEPDEEEIVPEEVDNTQRLWIIHQGDTIGRLEVKDGNFCLSDSVIHENNDYYLHLDHGQVFYSTLDKDSLYVSLYKKE